MTIHFILPINKPVLASWFIPIDISKWIGTEEIDGDVDFSARKVGGTDDLSDEVLDVNKCIWTVNSLAPYITGGSNNQRYRIFMRFSTNAGNIEEMALTFRVSDLM